MFHVFSMLKADSQDMHKVRVALVLQIGEEILPGRSGIGDALQNGHRKQQEPPATGRSINIG